VTVNDFQVILDGIGFVFPFLQFFDGSSLHVIENHHGQSLTLVLSFHHLEYFTDQLVEDLFDDFHFAKVRHFFLLELNAHLFIPDGQDGLTWHAVEYFVMSRSQLLIGLTLLMTVIFVLAVTVHV
jgi:hypothetical protein